MATALAEVVGSVAEQYTAAEIADELRWAADTLRRMPGHRLVPGGYRTAWPEAPDDSALIVQLAMPAHVVAALPELGLTLDDPELHRKLFRMGLGYFVPRYRPLEYPRPTVAPHEIAAMDERLWKWLPLAARGCAADAGIVRRRLLWLRALRVSWKACAKALHMHPSMCRRLHQTALDRVAYSLALSQKSARQI